MLLEYFVVNSEMFSATLPEEYREFLNGILPHFQENLIRAFRNASVRNQSRTMQPRHIHKLQDAFLSLNDNKIELRDLKLPWIPDFRVVNLAVNFEMLCLEVTFKLGNLTVEGEFEAYNTSMQKLLPVSNNGKVVITFSDVVAKGRVGLLIQSDSFVPANYDISYDLGDTEVRATCYTSTGQQVENKIKYKSEEATLGSFVWAQVDDILTDLLRQQLGDVVVEVSVTELLADEDAQLREMAQNHSSVSNRIFDLLLRQVKDNIVSNNLRRIETPSFGVAFRGKPSGLEQGIFESGPGYIEDLSTLTRPQDLSLFEDEKNLIIYGSLSLREFKHVYEKFTCKFETTVVEGAIKSAVYRNRILIKLVIDKNARLADLEKLEIVSIGDIDVDTSGLASLSWVDSKIESWTIGQLRYGALEVLENHIKECFDNVIKHLDWATLLMR